MGTIDLLLSDCWIWISEAISFGLVRMLLYLSNSESNGSVSIFSNTLRLTFFRLLSYS